MGKEVKRNLRKHINFLESIGANQFVLDIIREGYAVPLESNPLCISKIINLQYDIK